jgi:hypothetical protein
MNITEYTEVFADGSEIVYVRIDRGDNGFTSMPKDFYDKQQAEQSTPSLENGTIS